MKNLPYKQKTELRIKARFFYESYLYLMSNIERRRMNEEVGNRAILGTWYFFNVECPTPMEELRSRGSCCTMYQVVIRVRAEF